MIMHPPAKRRSARLGMMRVAMVAALALGAGVGLAQDAGAPPPVDDDSEIVVSGTAEDINRARNYIQALQVSSFNVQAARWADPICVGVTGTSPAIAERLAGRINAAASQIGAKRGEAGCKPNLLVIFARDASDYMAQMRRTSAAQLQEIPKRREAFTFGKTAPIRWWYSTDVMGADGRPLTAGGTGLVACGGPCALPSLNSNVRSQNTYSSSIVRAPTVRHIKSAVVVIDVPLAAGRSVDSLGDYAALVSLAELWPDNSTVPAGSILGLFSAPPSAAGEAPLLGTMDRRFLCELYRLPLDRSGQYHKGTLTRAVSAAQDRCFDAPDGKG
jgi:hypothetical protein